MQRIQNKEELLAAILLLEQKQAEVWPKLKEELYKTSESLKPLSIIKSTLKDVELLPVLKNKLISGVVGLAAGYFSKTILIGNSQNPVKKLIGALLETEVSSSIINEPIKIQWAIKLAKKLFNRKKSAQCPENGIAQL
jgi:hypothetical protein